MMILNKEPKSPLRYAGGKSRSVSEIVKFIPPETKSLAAPFMGGRWNLPAQIMVYTFTGMTILSHL